MKEDCAEFTRRRKIHIHAVLIVVVFLVTQVAADEGCVVRTTEGRCCPFPFVYQGSNYNSCIKKSGRKPWCGPREEDCDLPGFDGDCLNSNSILCGWIPNKGGRCRWKKARAGRNRLQLKSSTGSSGYASITKKFDVHGVSNGKLCVRFNNIRVLLYRTQFFLTVNGQESRTPMDGQGSLMSQCYQYKDELFLKVSLNVSCDTFNFNIVIEDLIVTLSNTLVNTMVNTTPRIMTTNDVTPTEIGDIQYVGVVVGAICIALFTLFSCLTIISARRSNQRDSRRHELQNGDCPEEDDRPDVVADNAPPSYDAVMACPNMYPPTPQGTPPGTPETTPYLSLHRRTLLNQLATSSQGSPQSQRQSMTPTIASEWDENDPGEPPPPYPGIANGNIGSRTSEFGSREDNIDNINTGESTSDVITSALRSDLSPEEDREVNPWRLNRMCNNSREMNPRRNKNAGVVDSESASDPGDIALRARTAGDIEDEGNQRTSVPTETPLVHRVLAEVAGGNDIQYADPPDSVPKSGNHNRNSTISSLALV